MTTLTEKTLFSIYGVSIEHPKDWKIFSIQSAPLTIPRVFSVLRTTSPKREPRFP